MTSIAARPGTGGIDVEALTRLAKDALAERVAAAEGRGEALNEEDRHQLAVATVSQALTRISQERIRDDAAPLTPAERQAITGAALRRVFSLLPELEQYLQDPDVTDIYVNGWDDVRVELRDGTYARGTPFLASDRELEEWVAVVARRAGREKAFNPANPRVRTQLPGGARFTAMSWVSKRPYVAIRCHRHADARLDDLRREGMFDTPLESLLRAAARARLNVMIAGDFGVGKTTLMRAMLHDGCDPDERIAVLEEEPELQLAEARPDLHDHVLCFETRDSNTEGQGAYSYGDLSKTMKWFRPRRIVVGEVQGAEVVDMLEAVTAGRGGAICTIHSESAGMVTDRIVMYAQKGGLAWSESYILRCTAAALKLVVHVARAADGRRVVSEVRQVVGYDAVNQNVVTNDVYVPGPDGSAVLNPSSQFSLPLRSALERHGYHPASPGPVVGGDGGGWS